LPLAYGRFVVVYDAEDVPDPNQLRHAAARFAKAEPEIACLQAHLVVDNPADGWLPSLFAIEYAALFDVINPGLIKMGVPVPLGGTSTHFRTDILRALGGWDAWNVTEDADLGIRLAHMGYRVGDLPSSTLEEAPTKLGIWMRQRARWMKGYMQVCITHSRTPLATWRKLGMTNFITAVTLVFGTTVSALVYPLFLLVTGLTLANGARFSPHSVVDLAVVSMAVPLLAFGAMAMVAPAVAGLKRRGLLHLVWLVPSMPAYYLLVSIAAWYGLYELVVASARWNKTEHGLARSSRSGRLIDSAGNPLPPRPAPA
jgi:cellulose synthase/poly-beta-1,6-N-acetylglucosamine synthase-like glycosyltransferase